MFKKKKIILQRDGNLLRIGGKWYVFTPNEDEDFRTGDYELIEVDKKKIDKQINFITEKLFEHVNKELIMQDALKDMQQDELEKLYNYIKKKVKLKPKLVKHCVRMDVGKYKIWLRG